MSLTNRDSVIVEWERCHSFGTMFQHLLKRVGTMRIVGVDNVVSGEGDNVVENSLNNIIKVWVISSHK